MNRLYGKTYSIQSAVRRSRDGGVRALLFATALMVAACSGDWAGGWRGSAAKLAAGEAIGGREPAAAAAVSVDRVDADDVEWRCQACVAIDVPVRSGWDGAEDAYERPAASAERRKVEAEDCCE